MTIPVNFTAPALPVASNDFNASAEDKFRSILRIYFNQIDNHTQIINEQVASNQTLIWLDM